MTKIGNYLKNVISRIMVAVGYIVWVTIICLVVLLLFLLSIIHIFMLPLIWVFAGEKNTQKTIDWWENVDRKINNIDRKVFKSCKEKVK